MKETYIKLCYILHSENAQSVYNLYQYLIRCNISKPFMWSVGQDNRNRTQYANHLNDYGLSLADKDFYLLSEHSDKITEYKKFISNIFVYVFGKKHTHDIDSVVEIETIFAKYTPDEWDKQNSDKNYVKITAKTLTDIGLDWEKFSNILGYSSTPSHIILNNRMYFEKVFSFLNKNWNTEKMRAYWVYNLVMSFSEYNKNLKKMCFEFFGRYLDGRKMDIPKKRDAVDTVCVYMNTCVSTEYLNKQSNSKAIKSIEDMSNLIRIHFSKRLSNNTWLTEKTKMNALKKLKSMRFHIGSKMGFIEDTDAEFCSNDSYKNRMIFSSWENKKMVQLSSRKYDINIWNRFETGNVFDVNAFYNSTNNEMILPCGILQHPFVDTTKGIEYSLGMLGTTIGHELTHGLDDDGCKYDHSGNYINWWTPRDMENYKKKQNLLIDVYKRVVSVDGYGSIDHRLSLGENMADIGGLVICEDVLESIYNKNGLSVSEKERAFKVFYKFYANSWRDKMTRETKDQQMNTNEHLHSKYRCNGSLMNSIKFREYYGLVDGDNMFNKNIVNVW